MENKQQYSSKGTSSKYLVALLFIAVGVLKLGSNLGWINLDVYHTLVSWQMLLIVIGVFNILFKHWWSGVILTVVGVSFLFPKLIAPWFWIDMSILTWPVILIIVGLLMLSKSNWHGTPRNRMNEFSKTKYETNDGVLTSENVFGGVKQVVLDEVFKGGYIHNKFGGTEIDLRRTTLAPGDTFIGIDCALGGVVLYVPSDWKVEFACSLSLGSAEDKRYIAPNIDQSKRLVIQGNISLGGLEIKS